jgi:hypothetical protein
MDNETIDMWLTHQLTWNQLMLVFFCKTVN